MSWMLVAPGAAFFVLALVFWKVRNGVESAPPDPPGVRSVVEWAGPPVPEVEDPTPGGPTIRALADELGRRGFDVGPVRDIDVGWEVALRFASGTVTVSHGFNGSGPWLTLVRPSAVPALGSALADWKSVLGAVDELLSELGARELHWFRHEDHLAGERAPTWPHALD